MYNHDVDGDWRRTNKTERGRRKQMYDFSGDCWFCPKCGEIMESSGQVMRCACGYTVDPVEMAEFEEWMLGQEAAA